MGINLRPNANGTSSFVDGVGQEVAVLGSGGTVAGTTGLSSVSRGAGAIQKEVFTFDNVELSLTDEAGVVAYAGLKLTDLPEGAILILGATADIDLTKDAAGVNDDWDGDFALGTATASNNATLSSTEANIIPSTATPQASSGATTANGQSTTTEVPLIIDGTSTAVDIYLNILVDDADHDVTTTATNLILNGTVTLVWCNLGDY